MRTTPAGITALRGVATPPPPVWLVKLELSSGTVYYSYGEAVSYGGNSYVANRVHSINSFEIAYIDRKINNALGLEIEIDNLADNGSATFPITALNAGVTFEDAKVTVFCYSPDAADAVLMTWGYVGGVKFNGGDKYAVISGTFFWNTLDSPSPSLLLPAKGFANQELAGKTGESNSTESKPVPILYGSGPMRVWPTVYNHNVSSDGAYFNAEFCLSGTHSGFPFNANDLQIQDLRLFGSTAPSALEFYPGNQVTAPANLTRFPENSAHTLCAFGFVSYPITNEIKDKLDSDDIFIRTIIQNGRPLVDTGIPSENGPLIVRDLLRDPVFGVGLSAGSFDTSVLTTTANYVGTRYQLRYEMSEQVPIGETIQRILADFHGFITFDGGLIQIRCKKNTESSVATFATIDSGSGGRKIHDDFVDVVIKDSSELINQATIKYRRKLKNRRIVTLYDPNAQARAGGTAKKVVEDVIDEWEMGGIYDETQAQILAAITVREEQNGNLFINFSVPIWDGLDVSPGDVITVFSPDIINNGSNNSFRVTKQSIDSGGDYLIHFECQVYKQAIYNDDATALGVDILRGGDDTNAQGRAPDVIPVSLVVASVGAPNDTGSKLATMRAVWTYPVVDMTADIAGGVFREYPIAEVDLWWRYTDENINQARRGANVKYPTAQADFLLDYDKTRSIECFFVAIGHNRARAPLGYIPDPTKVSSLTAIMAANPATTATVVSTANFTVNDYVQTEKEINQVLSKTGTVLTFVNSGGNRTNFFDSTAIAHPIGTEVAVAKQSYPSLIRSLAAPRFTYPVVTLTDILQRGGDGVRVRWTDVNPDNLEAYYVFWSKDADGGTNVAKLGSTTPAWYLADPRTPPTGVILQLATKQQTVVIAQEDIGPVGTQIFVRVAARNGKQNFSTALSNLGNSSVAAPGTTSPPTDFLGNVDIISNTYEQTPEGLRAKVIWRVYADATLLKTYGDTGCTSVGLVFQLTSSGGGKYRPLFPVEDPTVVFIDCITYFPLGESVTIIKGVAWNAGGKKVSTYNFTFFAGGQTPLAGITGFSITSITAIDEKHSYLAFGYTQPATPAVISHALILRQLAGEGAFTKERKVPLLNDLGNLTAGAKTFTEIVKHPKKNAVLWKIRLVSVDGTSLDSAAFSNTSPDVDTGAPNNGTAITINRAFLKKGAKLIVDFVLPTVQMASHSKNVLIIHDNNFTGTGRKFYDPYTSAWVATYPDGSAELSFAKGGIPALPIAPAEIFVGGRTQFYIRVGVYNQFNGSSVTYSGDLTTLVLQSGAGADNALGDAAVPSSLSAPDVQDQFGTLEVSCPRPGVNSATIKRYQVVLSTQNTAPAGAPTVGLEGVQKIKEGQGVNFRNKQGSTVTIYFYFRAENDFGFSSWSAGTSVTGSLIGRPADDVIGTGVPALAMALERNTSSGSGHTTTTVVLDGGANQTLNYYSGMALHLPSLGATDKVRTITGSVFSGGVVTVTVNTPYSVTPGNGIIYEIHYGLTLAGQSGSGHSTTTFVLPSAASAVDSFYNGMMLYIPSAATNQQLQRIVSYVGSTRTATIEPVETALAAAPANNAGFMLSSGSFGYASSNATGVIAPVPMRIWYNNESTLNIGEVILATGQNAYSLTDFQYQVIRQSNGAVRDDKKIAITSSVTFSFPALSYKPMVRRRDRNGFRGGGASDGWGAWSYYTPAFLSSAPPTTAYSPGVYVPIEVDPEAFGNLPAGKYNY